MKRMTNEEITEWEHRPDVIRVLTCYEMGAWLHRRDERLLSERVAEKTGRWIMHEKHRECSECTVWLPKDMPRNSFCPNCGAKMEKDGD